MTTIGRLFFAIAMVAFGVQHLVYMNFVTRVVPQLPSWVPFPSLLAGIFGAVLIAAGLSILTGIEARTVALLLGGIIFLSFVVFYIPLVVANLSNGGMLTNAGKALALAGGSFLVAGSIAADPANTRGFRATIARVLDRFIPFGRYCLAVFLMLGGILHFIYVEFVATLVPSWIPGQVFWTYFSGCALIAAGLGIIIPWTTRLAAMLTAIMIFIWVLVLHIPRALANIHNSNETTAVFEALAMSGIAILIATNPTGRKTE